MKTRKTILCGLLAVILALALALATTACGNDKNGNGDGARDAKTYTGTAASGVTYTLKIEDGGSRAVLTPTKGDKYTLTQTANTKKSTGTVTKVVGGELTLAPQEDPDDEFTATVSGDNITAMSGTITWDDGTANEAPNTLTTPSTGGTGDGVDSSWKWTAVSDSPLANAIDAIAWGNNRFVAGDWDGKMAYSADGASWTAVVDSTFGYSVINDIAWGNGRFVAVGMSGKIAYSADGESWTAVDATGAFGTTNIYSVAWGNNRWVAGDVDGKMAYSADGAAWTAVADSPFDSLNYVYAIAYGNNRFVAGALTGQIAYSDDNGVTWTAVADSKFGNSGIDAIAYGNGKFVAVGSQSKIAYSTDGASWTAVANSGFSSRIWGIAFGSAGNAGSRFVAGGDNGSMAYSADGASWTALGEGILGTYTTIMGNKATADISAVAYGNGRFVAVGQGGKIAYADW